MLELLWPGVSSSVELSSVCFVLHQMQWEESCAKQPKVF